MSTLTFLCNIFKWTSRYESNYYKKKKTRAALHNKHKYLNIAYMCKFHASDATNA